MDIRKSDIVCVRNGRHEGKYFFVVDMEEDFAEIADGRIRRIEKPKRKKLKHIDFAGRSSNSAAEKLKSGDAVTNSELRKALAEFRQEQHGEKGDMQVG